MESILLLLLYRNYLYIEAIFGSRKHTPGDGTVIFALTVLNLSFIVHEWGCETFLPLASTVIVNNTLSLLV